MIATDEPLVSIVTPFYNTEAYLAECIESVLSQSYEHWEYLLVNNCSTDGSLAIAEKYAAIEPRIRVSTNQTFLGQVQNYNHALSLVSPDAKYVKMVQADDFLFPECISKMILIALSNPSIGIVSSYRLKGSDVAGSGLGYRSTVISGRELCRQQLLNEWSLFGSPTSVLYRSDFVSSRIPFFSEGKFHEDTDVCFEILRTSDFGFVHQILSFTRMENDSITGSVYQNNPGVLDQFTRVHQYGPVFLTSEEFKSCFANTRRGYYLFLAESLFKRKGKGFWEYHRVGLGMVGLRISPLLLFRSVLCVIVDLILNPWQTAGILWRTLQQRKVSKQ